MSQSNPTNYGSLWSREELILAFDLYCRIPFRKTKANNPEVIALARLLDRSPAGVARKLGNFGSFDPELQRRDVKGLIHSSKMDAEVWQEFSSNWNRLVLEARRLRTQWKALSPDFRVVASAQPEGPSEREVITKSRVHQAFFRDAILSSYDHTCCITGLRVGEVLVASHIVPWSVSAKLRTDPHNGLCLSATFDRLFDRGLLTVSPDLRVLISGSLRSTRDERVGALICCYHGKPILRPSRFLPREEHLDWHRTNVFHD